MKPREKTKRKRRGRVKEISGIGDLTFDPGNLNKGTARGASALAASVDLYGVGRGIVVDRKGVVIGGNKTTAELLKRPDVKVVTVPADGKTLVVTQRTDLELGAEGESGQKARGLSLADNRTAELGFDVDAERLATAIKGGLDIRPWYDLAEIEALAQGKKKGGATKDVNFTARAEKKAVKCPHCGKEFTPEKGK